LRDNAGRAEVKGYVGHQEIELEAIGMIQSSVKRGIHRRFPAGAIPLEYFPMQIKLRRFPLPFTQGPPNMWVPSMREQMRGAARSRDPRKEPLG
jgi:hypothetical protein